MPMPMCTSAQGAHSQKGLNPALPPCLMLFAARIPPKTAVSTVLQAFITPTQDLLQIYSCTMQWNAGYHQLFIIGRVAWQAALVQIPH